MNIDEMTYGEMKQIAAIMHGSYGKGIGQTLDSDMIGRYVIVRTYSAGVHVGVLEKRNGREVMLSDTRRIWRWTGANTLSEISLRGVGRGSKVSDAIPENLLMEAIEVIPCSSDAEKNLRGASWGE